ncbi:MAG: class I SAM-dependent methyltransferase [Leptospirales bacterium]
MVSLQDTSPACPFCEAASNHAFSAKDWNQQASDQLFGYFTCNGCKLTFIEHIPDNLSQYYLHEQYCAPESLDVFLPRANAQAWKVDILKAFICDGALLEIGPATGEFAYMARQAGFKPKLLELDADCCKFIREELDLDVTQTNSPSDYIAENYAIKTGMKFDAICIWQTIEHIPECWKLLDGAVECLNNNGVLVVSTPNPLSFQARALGRRWPHIDAPRHLYLIPQEWLVSFAQRHNLSVELNTTRDIGSLGLNYYGWYLAVRNLLPLKSCDGTSRSIARIITRLLRQRESTETHGCSYTIALRRRK